MAGTSLKTGPYLLGIDSGLTVTKAVVFDANGNEVGSSAIQVPKHSPRPRWVERDSLKVWEACQHAIHAALGDAGISGAEIAGIGVTGHGDGVYLVDADGRPTRPGIASLDTRAYEVVQQWHASGIMDEVLELTGQHPFPATPAALMRWIKEFEPEVLARTRWVLSCKDWIRFKLTGEFATDRTEASTSFADVRSQTYSSRAFALFGLEDVEAKLPPMLMPSAVAGRVTQVAADETSLTAGTPVVAGMHDVDACAIASGCIHPGQLAVIAGTYSINEVIAAEPVLDPRWSCRNFVRENQWLNMAISPASATNLDWYLQQLCQAEIGQARQQGISPYAFVNREVEAVLNEKTDVYFLPFMYGSPHGDEASAAFVGLRGWHTRGHMLRAVYEGVAFNHKTHVDALRSAFPTHEVRMTGGGTRSPLWCQIFTDTFALPVVVVETQEAGALGTAICAGLGSGVYTSYEEAISRTVRTAHVYEPDPAGQERLAEAYRIYRHLIDALMPVWKEIGGSL